MQSVVLGLLCVSLGQEDTPEYILESKEKVTFGISRAKLCSDFSKELPQTWYGTPFRLC